MKSLFTPLSQLLLVTILLFTSFVFGQPVAESPNVQELTDTNFNSVVGGDKPTMVLFYSPKCGHCIKFQPIFAEAANKMAGQNIIFARIDAVKFSGNADLHGIKAFPTLKLFPRGKNGPGDAIEYGGKRTVADIEAFINEKK